MMTSEVTLGRLSLQHDDDYGIDHRRGWSISWEGSFVAELMPFVPAGLQVWRRIRNIRKWQREEAANAK
jgi:hypothetical protein